MELAQALKRVGATIVKEKTTGASATYYLRVDIDRGGLWSALVSELLLNAVNKPYQLDVSKYFYASQGEVLYLWRVVITGELETAQIHWAQIAVQVFAVNAPELTQMPLVGRVNYPFDPARGKLKGSHDVEDSLTIISMAAGSGTPVAP